MNGPAYWSITPAIQTQSNEQSAVPIGFDTDAEYLGGVRRRLAEAVMAVPSNVARATSTETFRYQTLMHLLRCRELRLISVWHPSFLVLLLEALPDLWERLIKEIATGNASRSSLPKRAAELRAANPLQPETLWPNLRIVSCWGDCAASLALENLRRRFPCALIQPKGLIATEAFVSVPFRGQYPLAINSHFCEFIDSNGHVFPAEALRDGEKYEIVVTTAGGLWRYRVGDHVVVTGFTEKTPSLKFVGRGGDTSDLFGEKLSETFVNEAFREVFGHDMPSFALLAPDEQGAGYAYTLYVEGTPQRQWAGNLDGILRRNPHYAYCRELGQLKPLRLFVISQNGFETFARKQAAPGVRLGDIKAVALSRKQGWSQTFSGKYADWTAAFS
jgi:hypothetical protein